MAGGLGSHMGLIASAISEDYVFLFHTHTTQHKHTAMASTSTSLEEEPPIQEVIIVGAGEDSRNTRAKTEHTSSSNTRPTQQPTYIYIHTHTPSTLPNTGIASSSSDHTHIYTYTHTPSIPHIHTGIAGLAVANALQQRGLKVKVFERAPLLDRQRGAGTGLSTNGQLCLHSLGFSHKEILKISTPIQEHILCDGGGDVLVRSDYPMRLFDKYGSPLTGV